MKITDPSLNYTSTAYAKNANEVRGKEGRDAKPDTRNEGARPDAVVTISDSIKDLQTARQAVDAVPAETAAPDRSGTNRSEKIAALTRAVREGAYEVDPEKIAEKILATHIDQFV